MLIYSVEFYKGFLFSVSAARAESILENDSSNAVGALVLLEQSMPAFESGEWAAVGSLINRKFIAFTPEMGPRRRIPLTGGILRPERLVLFLPRHSENAGLAGQ